jgi:DDB1- and CUL4-associated factor 13
VSFAPSGDVCVTAGTDATARLYRIPFAPFHAGEVVRDEEATMDFHGKFAFSGVDHHWVRNVFATAGAQVRFPPHPFLGVDQIWVHNLFATVCAQVQFPPLGS